MVAAALIDGRVDLATLTVETIKRRDIRALAARIQCETDVTLGAGFDGRADIICTDGRLLSRVVRNAPLSETHIISKFTANTARCPRPAREALLGALLEEAPRSRELICLATKVIVSSA